MKNYTIEFSGTGEISKGRCSDDLDAIAWVETVLNLRGYDPNTLVQGDWDADGANDDGEPCYRMLFWANEEDAENDPGVKSICQLCKVRDA